MWQKSIENAGWRVFGDLFWKGAIVAITILVVYIAWMLSGICLDTRYCPKDQPPAAVNSTVVRPTQVYQTDFAFSEDLEENIYQGHQINLASYPPAGSNEVYVLHGDLLNDGRCHIIVSRHGERPNVLTRSRGGFRLMRVTGSDSAIETEVSRIQAGAAAYAKSTCPRLPH